MSTLSKIRKFTSTITQSKLKFIILIIITATIPLTVFVVQQRQEIRKGALAFTYTFNSSSTVNTPDQNNLSFWARKKSDGSYIPMDNTWWTGSKYAYIDTDDGDRGYFHNAPQASPNPTPATPASTSYTLPDQFSSSTQGERWEYYYLEAGSISTSALTPGTGRNSQWFGDGWTVAGGGSWALINKREIGGGQPDKLRIIPGDNQKVYVYWKAPGPGQATINVRSTKTDSQGGGYKLGIAYTPDLANKVVANNISLQDPFVVWGNQINEEKPLSGSHQMNGNDALVFYVDPDNGVVIQGGQTDTFAFGDVSENTITVQFTPTPPTAAPTTAPATNPTIDGMDANFKIAPGSLAPSLGYNAVARWTAPNAGNVTINGSFKRCCTDTPPELPDENTRTIYRIRKVGSPTDIWSETIDNDKINTYRTSNIINSVPFTISVPVQAANEAIEFMVDSGNDGSGWDSSTVDFTIQYSEPPTPTAVTPTAIPTTSSSITQWNFSQNSSSTQHLSYLSYVKGSGNSPSTYYNATQDSSRNKWTNEGQPGADFNPVTGTTNFSITQGSMAPSSGANAVVRWTAPPQLQAGNITIAGHFQRCCTEAGQGETRPYTRYSIRKNGTNGTEVLWTQEASDQTDYSYPQPNTSPTTTSIAPGENIEFWVDAVNGSGWDASNVEFTINYTEFPTPEPTSTLTPTPTEQSTVTPTPTQLTGDITGDGIVDLDDFTVFVEHFGPRMPEGGSPADFTRDGKVDLDDFNIFVENFGRRINNR